MICGSCIRRMGYRQQGQTEGQSQQNGKDSFHSYTSFWDLYRRCQVIYIHYIPHFCPMQVFFAFLYQTGKAAEKAKRKQISILFFLQTLPIDSIFCVVPVTLLVWFMITMYVFVLIFFCISFEVI